VLITDADITAWTGETYTGSDLDRVNLRSLTWVRPLTSSSGA
jgi:hypothetical protein